MNTLTLLFCHLIGDYFLQTEQESIDKSKDFKVLLWHVLKYSLSISVYAFIFKAGILWVIINFTLHLTTDFFSSKIIQYFRNKEMNYTTSFFKVLDQITHYSCLLLTL